MDTKKERGKDVKAPFKQQELTLSDQSQMRCSNSLEL